MLLDLKLKGKWTQRVLEPLKLISNKKTFPGGCSMVGPTELDYSLKLIEILEISGPKESASIADMRRKRKRKRSKKVG